MKKLHATDHFKDFVSYSVKLTFVLCWNGFGVVSIWRGLWVLQDYYIFPDNDGLSAWISGLIGTIMLLIALVIRNPLDRLAVAIDLWKFTTMPSMKSLFSGATLTSGDDSALYHQENQIETPDLLVDKKKSKKIFSSAPHAGLLKGISKNYSVNEDEEGTILIPKQPKSIDDLAIVGKKMLHLTILLAGFAQSFAFSSFLNLMILNVRFAVWVTVKSYYWFLGATAVAYHRWVWMLWDVYTEGDYFAVFIFVSILLPTVMLLPVTSEWNNIGGTPIAPEFFNVAEMALFKKLDVVKKDSDLESILQSKESISLKKKKQTKKMQEAQ